MPGLWDRGVVLPPPGLWHVIPGEAVRRRSGHRSGAAASQLSSGRRPGPDSGGLVELRFGPVTWPCGAHLGPTAGDPLTPGGQAPHRVWVRLPHSRCGLVTQVPLGARSGPSARPHRTRAGPSRWGCAHTGCRPGGPSGALRRRALSRPQGRQVGEGRQGRSLLLSSFRDRTCLGGWRDPRAARLQPLPLGRGLQPPQRLRHGRLRVRLWRPHPSSARYADLIPGWGTKIPHAAGQLRPMP